MALKSCSECGAEVSTKAAACPKCGAPVKASNIGCAIVAAIGLVIFVIILIVGGNDQSTRGADTPALDKSPPTQQRRKELLGKLQGLEVFGKIECHGKGADVWVKPGFYALSFDDKQSFSSVAYAYCFSDSDSYVTLRDSQTGKDVGTYWGNRGLQLE